MTLPLTPEQTAEYNNLPCTPPENPLGTIIGELNAGVGGGFASALGRDLTSQMVQFCRANGIAFEMRVVGWTASAAANITLNNADPSDTLVVTAVRGESSGGSQIFEDPTITLDLATDSEQISDAAPWALTSVGVLSPSLVYWDVLWAAPIYVLAGETLTGTWDSPFSGSGTFTYLQMSAADAATVRAAFGRLYLGDATVQFVGAGAQTLNGGFTAAQDVTVTSVLFGMFDPSADPDFTVMRVAVDGTNIVDLSGGTFEAASAFVFMDRSIGFDLASGLDFDFDVTLAAPPAGDTDVPCMVFGRVA